MQLNGIKPSPGSKFQKKRVGRGMGSGLGKTCGRGHKGQKSRSGGKVRPGFEGGQQPLQMRLPKFGFNSARAKFTGQVTLSEIANMRAEVIDLQALKDANILKGSIKKAKVILSGSIGKAVTLKGLGITKGARVAIEAVGGKVED